MKSISFIKIIVNFLVNFIEYFRYLFVAIFGEGFKINSAEVEYSGVLIYINEGQTFFIDFVRLVFIGRIGSECVEYKIKNHLFSFLRKNLFYQFILFL